ncbi:DMT family transporter [uncultured Desulfobacter sp.]|uniref:DMT family transporter n=1 Tax=uncultured Desulfobacter sp. TaxID=240139 RepID=UPI002AAAD46C|nr:DMT family transporter [uncultured Desulfobacter sp.]
MICRRTLKSDSLLVITAAVWGFAFVAQRVGMEHLGPFTFNGIRFLLGAFSLVPLLVLNRKRKKTISTVGLVGAGIICGVILFCAASLQQVGLLYTTAGKAGFITGVYVILVPFLNLFFQQERITPVIWTGAVLALAGIFLLSVKQDFRMGSGDLLVLACAFGFAGHLLIVGYFAGRFSSISLSFVQFLVCGVLSLVVAGFSETATPAHVKAALIPLCYGGFMSVGLAYSLQVYAQKQTPASHAAIIFSLESVFAALGGWLLLDEILSGRGLLGCILILAGIIISQMTRK